MSHRLLINLFLFLAVVVIGILLFVPDNPDIEEDVILTDLDPVAVTRITILRAGNEDITFAKQGDRWIMQSPYELPANPVRINTMLGLLQAHSYTQLNQYGLELHRFALDQPAVSVRFNDTQVDFGATSPVGRQRYVRVAETVHLINDSLYEQLQTPATFFLSHKLLPENASVSAIEFPDIELRWQEERWQLLPEQDISADVMARVVNAWQQAQAVSIREYEEAEAHGTITVELREGDPLQFVIVNPAPQLVLARTDLGLQYHLSSHDAEQLVLQTEENSESPPSPPSPLKGEGE